MSSKIVGWLVGDWDGKFSALKKILKKKKKYSEINLKKGNPTFLPIHFFVIKTAVTLNKLCNFDVT